MASSLVHYVLLRTDLGWPKSALATQAVHASNTCLFRYFQDPLVQNFLDSESNMCVILKQIPSLTEFNNLISELTSLKLDHSVWIEEPEHIPVAIAIKPYERKDLNLVIGKFKLF